MFVACILARLASLQLMTGGAFRSSSSTGSLMNDKRLIKTGNIGTLVLHGQPQVRRHTAAGAGRLVEASMAISQSRAAM